jgi:spore maturation protein CgeB
LIVGDWRSELHEESVKNALVELGHDVFAFKWCSYFRSESRSSILNLFYRIQNKFIIGNAVSRLNKDLIKTCEQVNPDVLFVYRGTHIVHETLSKVKFLYPNCILVSLNNDDPFSRSHKFYLWRHFLKAVPIYDLVLAYRHKNILEYKSIGARHVELFRSWFIKTRNYPKKLSIDEAKNFNTDVVFVGHYENDGRMEYLEALVKEGVALKIFGPGYDWDPAIANSQILKKYIPVRLVWGDEYNSAICGAKIALCFLSKLNNDTYTRRCFEIPASGTMLLSEYSDDLASIYQEGVQAEFFRDKEEMLSKVKFYLKNPNDLERMALKGRAKVIRDGHDVLSRMKNLCNFIKEIRNGV